MITGVGFSFSCLLKLTGTLRGCPIQWRSEGGRGGGGRPPGASLGGGAGPASAP